MFRPSKDDDKMFRAMASSGAVEQLVAIFERYADEEQESLSTTAIAAILKPENEPLAKMQLGRVQMLNDLIHTLRKYA